MSNKEEVFSKIPTFEHVYMIAIVRDFPLYQQNEHNYISQENGQKQHTL